jgi:hypothetical protein
MIDDPKIIGQTLQLENKGIHMLVILPKDTVSNITT